MIEEQLQKGLYSQVSEKTYIDKILARQDVEAIREIIRKKNWSREDVLELLYLLSGAEAKLVNYGDWDRYVVLKFYVWIRDFVSKAEGIYDYNDFLKAKKAKGEIVLSDHGYKMMDNNNRLIEHQIKFLVDLYLNITRTSLSKGATGFLEILKNKYEILYPNMPAMSQPQEEKRGFLVRK